MSLGLGQSSELAATLTTDEVTAPPEVSVKDPDRRHGRSPSQIAWDRLKGDTVAIACFAVVIFFILVAVFAPLLVRLEGEQLNLYHSDLISALNTYPTIGANSQHWFGVEPRTGRDLFAVWAYGARPSLIIGFVAATLSTIAGITFGLLAGYLGGTTDKVIGWVIDLLLSLPLLVVVLAVVPVIQQRFTPAGESLTAEQKSGIRFYVLIVILVFFGWTFLARLIRGEVLSLREREFVQAAKVIGVPTRHILFKEILPNLVGPIIVAASIAVPAYITLEATLSYLGAGLVEPTPSWGRTVSNAQNAYARYPLFLWPPVISIASLVLALTLLGEAIRDAFDPNTRR
jgi:ABC-type dipeptide/oligopeptide/nickel transport system permease subunit